MPDLQQFSVARNAGTTNLAVPTWTISFQIRHSQTGALLADFTGANAFSFPQVFASFSQADQNELVQKWCMDLIQKRRPDLF